MAILTGKDGRITFTGGSTTIRSWVLNYVGDALETSNFDDSSGGKTYMTGLTSWGGTFEGLYSTANTVVPTAGCTGLSLVLGTSTGVNGVWYGSCVITGVDFNTSRPDLVTQSFSFQGTGLLATST